MDAAQAPTLGLAPPTVVRVHQGTGLAKEIARLEGFAFRNGPAPLSRHPGWLAVMQDGLGHTPYLLEAVTRDKTSGFLALSFVHSLLFGKFLVSLPYLDQGGVLADDAATSRLLIDQAVKLAESLGVRYLELRQGQPIEHSALSHRLSSKVQMHLPLPSDRAVLWDELDGKVRNQIRKGQKSELEVVWGGLELLRDFYGVFSHNMRDLGTPTYSKGLFASILGRFPGQAELCVVRAESKPAAAALVLHGQGISAVPSASCLRKYNPTCANMLLYWHLLERSVQRQQSVFDFGRCNREGPTHRFKAQWGAKDAPAEWQYYMRKGTVGDMRPENPRYRKLITIWKRLPVRLTRLVGPAIVRGIP